MSSRLPSGPWRTLLETALHAPSPHNVQPWRVRVLGETEAELLIEKHRTLPKEDVTGSFIILTMGMFVETLRLVAAHHGLGLDDELVRDPSWFAAEHLESLPGPCFPFARLRLRPDLSLRAEYPIALFHERRTSRLAYRTDPLTADAASRLADLAGRWEHRYVQTTDAATIEQVLDWNVEAVFEDLTHPPYRDELESWIRYGQAHSDRERDGLDARCMNQSPLELWLAFHAPGMLAWRPLRPWFRRRYRAQIGPVTTMGFLCGPFWNPGDAYATGRLLMHFWLECTRLGYYLHPYGNLVTNRPVAERVEAAIGSADIWLAFKIGRSDPPPKSHRRPIEEILLD